LPLICVLGDAHLDVVVGLAGPVAAETDTPADTWVGVGGQAANVAAWVSELGGQARLIAARGSDLAAGLVASDLERRGVTMAGPVLDGRTGVVVSLSEHGTRRSMLTDRGVGPMLTADALRGLLERTASVPLTRRREIRGLDPDRAPVIVAGIAILLEVLDFFGLDRVEASEHDILWGVALEAENVR